MGMLEGMNVVVTGATGGIGRAVVESVLHEGGNIWACARKENEGYVEWLHSVARESSGAAQLVQFDLCDSNAMKEAVQQIRSSAKVVDVLVNNAGMVAENSSFSMMSQEKLEKVFDVNFLSPTIFTQYILRLMRKSQNPSIVNVASVAALDGSPGQYEYVTSKAAVCGMTKKLAGELGSQGVRVNAVAPGIVDTSMGSAVDDSLRREYIDSTALGRIAKPSEIASAITFLASPGASYITGQVIRVDGGRR